MMPTIYDVKPAFQGTLRPAARRLAGLGVTANQVTIAAAVLSLLMGGLIALFPGERRLLLLLPLVLFLRMALNAIDGMLAREHGLKTARGAIFNELGDVLSDSALYLPLALVPGVPAVSIVVVVLLAIITEMAGVLAVVIGTSRRHDGPMGKSDRAFLFGALGLALGLGLAPGLWLEILLVIVIGLLMVTIVNRARRALAAIR